jgi:hypothetical protein
MMKERRNKGMKGRGLVRKKEGIKTMCCLYQRKYLSLSSFQKK